jgi:nitrite reductase/ring-hydroxylating ferredoxin subunit
MMSTPSPQGVPLCEAPDLVEGGRAHVFELREHGELVRAFALRHEGSVVAYLNRCAHVPIELDWQPGEFLDDTRQWIVCAMHGAIYDPRNGQCMGGPCHGEHLESVAVAEHEGRIYWYPRAHLTPA